MPRVVHGRFAGRGEAPASQSHRGLVFSNVPLRDLQQVTHALIREWTPEIAVATRGTFVDFDVNSLSALNVPNRHRFRLFLTPAHADEIRQLEAEASALGLAPVAVAPLGFCAGANPVTIPVVTPDAFHEMCEQSAVIDHDEHGMPTVNRVAWRELRDYRDARFALISGLLWLRPLSRNRVPPSLRWAGTPAHELFESCFFVVMTTVFQATGACWGTRKRGQPVPDGRLRLPGVIEPTLYDCKAAAKGYQLTHRDLTGFVDYLRQPIEHGWTRPTRGSLRFLIVSSQVRHGRGVASFAGRQRALSRRVRGARMTCIAVPDLVRFGLAIESAGVSPADRRRIGWSRILDAGDVKWDAFEAEIRRLEMRGYMFQKGE
jgi:hypothetical protein